MKNKKGASILAGNVVYIVLVIAFFSILFIFIARQSSDTALLEKRTAKQLALIIDAAESGTKVTVNLGKVWDGKEERISDNEAIRIVGNGVFVKLSSKGGYSYGFFNDVQVATKRDGEFLELDIK